MLDEVYEELRCESDQYPVLLSEPVVNPKSSREEMIQVLFETFHVPAAYSCAQASLSLFATGRTTGMILVFFLQFTRSIFQPGFHLNSRRHLQTVADFYFTIAGEHHRQAMFIVVVRRRFPSVFFFHDFVRILSVQRSWYRDKSSTTVADSSRELYFRLFSIECLWLPQKTLFDFIHPFDMGASLSWIVSQSPCVIHWWERGSKTKKYVWRNYRKGVLLRVAD